MLYIAPAMKRIRLYRDFNHAITLLCKVVMVFCLAILIAQTVSANPLKSIEYRGNISGELQGFTENAVHSADQRVNASLSAEVELFYPFARGNQNLLITPFVRLDQNDSSRTHFDFREFLYQWNSDNWEIQAGLGKVFWGVAESVNIVDIINTRDSVEGILDNEKLGQPMIQLSWLRDRGSLEFYVLPGFRDQTFAGIDGRPRFPFLVDTSLADTSSFTSGRNVDFALRYTTSINDWDLGFSIFDGTDRNPVFVPVFGNSPADIRLQPVYGQITQAGIDAQATLESWLLKFEGIFQSGDLTEDHLELVTGFEYSFFGLFDTDTDLGIITEYLFDDRNADISQAFQNDLLFGMRLALNDENSSEALIGSIIDLDSQSLTLTLEASRRIGNAFTISANAVIWSDTSDDPLLQLLSNEDFFELEVSWFF